MHSITLQTAEATVVDGDVLGRIGFAASAETGSEALKVAAKIEAVAEETFNASNNATEMVFYLAGDGDAAAKMTLSSAGFLTVSAGMVGNVGAGVLSGIDTDLTFDWATGNYHEATLNSAAIDLIKFTNVTVGQRVIVRIQNDDSAARTVSWSATQSGLTTSVATSKINWAGGIVPVATAAVDKADVYGFICRTATKFDGFIIGQNLANTNP